MCPSDPMPIISTSNQRELQYFIRLFKYHMHKMKSANELPSQVASDNGNEDEDISTAFVATTLITPKKEPKF